MVRNKIKSFIKILQSIVNFRNLIKIQIDFRALNRSDDKGVINSFYNCSVVLPIIFSNNEIRRPQLTREHDQTYQV